MIWSIGATGDNDSWIKFSKWTREKMTEHGVRGISQKSKHLT